MPAAKKKTKKKAVTKKTTKKLVKKKIAKKPAKKKAAAKKVAKKPTKKKSTATPAKKKKASKKQATKRKNNSTDKISKKPAKAQKKSTKKPAAKKSATNTTKKAAKKTKARKISMTKTKNNTKISPPVLKKPTPTIKEDKKMNVTMEEELEFAPYAINRGEDYMTDEQMEHFRKILLRWKQQLMQEVDSTVGHMKEEGLSYPDPVDRASQEEGFNLELRTRDRERKLIKKIESALDSIETGDYGFCEDCGADIGVRRLEARPTATKCIDCKTYQEIRERQAGG